MTCRSPFDAEMALREPALAAGLVFVDGSQLGHGDPAEARRTIGNIIDQLGYEHVMQVNFAGMFNDPAHPDCARIVARASAMPEKLGRKLWAAMVSYDAGELEPRYAEIVQPMTILQSSTVEVGGRRRSLTPDESDTPYLTTMRRLVPHAEVMLAPGVGHFIQLEEPQLVVDAILDTSRRTPAGSAAEGSD